MGAPSLREDGISAKESGDSPDKSGSYNTAQQRAAEGWRSSRTLPPNTKQLLSASKQDSPRVQPSLYLNRHRISRSEKLGHKPVAAIQCRVQ